METSKSGMSGKRHGSRSMVMAGVAALAALAGGGNTFQAVEIGLPSTPPRFARSLVFGGGAQSMRGHGRRNWPGRKPPGTSWAGDGVMPATETRQMRRVRERAT
jgi:hypothetical protein